MKKEVMKKWVDALRSGKYEQTDNALKRDNAFCCLGVLCDISEISYWKRKNDGDDGEFIYAEQYTNLLPIKVAEWAGMKNASGSFQSVSAYSDDYKIDTLARMNDDNVQFTEIADIIESKWEEL